MVSVQIAALVAALAAGGETVLLDFQASWCAPCRAMDPAMAELERAGYPVRKVDVDRERHLANQYHVQNIPCFILLVNGQEAARLTGAVRRDELVALFQRAGVPPGTAHGAVHQPMNHAPTVRGQSPDVGGRLAQVPHTRFNQAKGAPEETLETAAHANKVDSQELIASCVRLTVGDPQGFSYGSGTIIDSRQGEALVLTCGHIFRDSQGKGQISVDLCAAGAPQKLPGRLVSYDLKNDIGLVSIKPGVPVRVAPVAAKSYRPNQGDAVVTVGCNNGGPATALDSRITSINKFLGPSNLQVAGLPVQGRSGGGLFSADGQVIGVCNAADPADNEGLYAALPVIQEELDELGLTALYQRRGPVSPAAALTSNQAMPGPAPENFPAQHGAPAATGGMRGLSPAEQAALAEVSNRHDGAEVICIVRPLANPQAKSEVIMLDRASSAFLKQLAADREAQEGRHLTSLEVRQAKSAKPVRR